MSTQEQRDRFYTFAEFAKRRVTMDGYPAFSAQDAWNTAWVAAEAAAIERCAKICDEWQRTYVLERCCDLAQHNALKSVAAAIRALLPKEE